MAQLAQQHEVARNLLFAWRKQGACGELAEPAAAHGGFIPVRVMPEGAIAAPAARQGTPSGGGDCGNGPG